MKKLKLSTRKKSVTVEMELSSDRPVELYIVGYDALSNNTEYFTRRITFQGDEIVFFECPQTPKVLSIIAWGRKGDEFEISDIEMTPMQRDLSHFGAILPDIKLIEAFARRAGRLPARGAYKSKGSNFKIQYLPVIRKDNGDPHPTPARIHVSKPLVQVSKRHFRRMSIPQRVAILTHEYSHNFVNGNKDSEMEADANMVQMYDALGYGKLEAVYAFANVMSDTDTNYSRLLNIQNRLNGLPD